jgi:hypothetical protein
MRSIQVQTFLTRFWEKFRVPPDSEKKDVVFTIMQSLINDIVYTNTPPSLMDLMGAGKDLFHNVDVDEFLRQERDS